MGESFQCAGRHHRGLVHHDDAAGGDGVVLSPLDPTQDQGGGLRWDARLALEDVCRLALPGDADHRDSALLVGLSLIHISEPTRPY